MAMKVMKSEVTSQPALNVDSDPADPSISIVKRKEEVEKKGKDYTGIFFPVRFCVDKPVELLKVGFVGVTEKSECSKFIMGIEILQEVNGIRAKGDPTVLYPRERHPVTGEKGKGFVIELKRPVLIPANCDVVLRFQVKELGDDKHSKVRLNSLKEVKPTRVAEKETKVAFFFYSSSAAVNELHFRAAK